MSDDLDYDDGSTYSPDVRLNPIWKQDIRILIAAGEIKNPTELMGWAIDKRMGMLNKSELRRAERGLKEEIEEIKETLEFLEILMGEMEAEEEKGEDVIAQKELVGAALEERIDAD